jgi:NADH:ubiquinone oxidoreductase subunit E
LLDRCYKIKCWCKGAQDVINGWRNQEVSSSYKGDRAPDGKVAVLFVTSTSNIVKTDMLVIDQRINTPSKKEERHK